ncbi:hypothetical protein DFQ14_102394 [Halopolyspora algeriensis]|uniref:Uncharacterized protein n=1 Tax=Halopolyspora algeriensis TaxID=1500506 RepID=A0A368VZ30_9ACTN|nr:hypothetical protein [Halopolyspora algeriensis]RCW46092.1 hypothetical protein DFQ14_102394 [Halopolyspora algeriensis]TQM55497.1 hypothetical protein FHU43_0268 [Halopolyspora algeriensis]
MKSAHAVVGAWATGNLVLALILLFAFRPAGFIEQLLYIWSTALVAGFGVAVLLATRAGRVGTQRRQPRRAAAGIFAALGLAVGLTGFAYGWWLSVIAFYPLVLAAWLARGERLRRGTRPWPAALGDTEPAGPPRFVHYGSSLGTATAVPAEHAAHGPPAPPPPRPPHRLRKAALLAAGARAVVEMLRRRRR